MEFLFSNTNEEIAKQVENDIDSAKESGVVDTEELKYEHVGDGNVMITDKENGEITIAKKAADVADTYDLMMVPDDQLEKFLHPSFGENGNVKPGDQVGAPDEAVENHYDEVNDYQENPSVEAQTENREFSVSTDNSVVLRIFSDQAYCDRLFSEVIESEETAVVGDLKIEKVDGEDNTVVVTDKTTGDQAKVELDGEDMNVTELDTKEYSDEENLGFLPTYIVGIDVANHALFDTFAYGEENVQALVSRMEEDGIQAIQVFDNLDDARSYANDLLDQLGATSVDEPVQIEYSEINDLEVHTFSCTATDVMERMFSEAAAGISDIQEAVEDAIESGDQIETDTDIITPVDAINAVIEDKETGEFTKATISGETINLEGIDEEEAQDITGDLSILESESKCDDEDEEGCGEDEEKLYCDADETRFFSESEEMTNYMVKIFSFEAEQDAIEDAIESGDQIETDTEVITPVDSKTAVIEDKENDEITKAVILDEDRMNLSPISQDEAENLTQDLSVAVDEIPEDEEEEVEVPLEEEDEEEEDKNFSEFTAYMTRLFSEEADSAEIEDAIESGEQIENDTEIITPVDNKTAVIEDKENGEFTKATLDEDEVEVAPISEQEADKLTEGLKVEEDEDEKEFSVLDKWFAEIAQPQAPVAEPAPKFDPQTGAPLPQAEVPSVEQVEDLAQAAVESINAAAATATSAILEAKATPAQAAEPDLQEAQFSENDNNTNDTLVSWLNQI
jgi:hypothetical protein